MQRKLGRNYLNLCFTKIKKPIAAQSPPRNPPSHPTDHDRSRPFSSSAAFIKNYNSLYHSTSSSSSSSFSGDVDPEAHFAAAFTSHRFFFSSPGLSNSIIESTITAESTTSPSSSASASDAGGNLVFNNSMAISTYSPDPYVDFRRSMQEMVEALEQMDVKKSSWEFLQELLLCYLALNPKNTHKYIVGAFADLAAVIKPPLPPSEEVKDGTRNRASC